jgi:hypothetical protein
MNSVFSLPIHVDYCLYSECRVMDTPHMMKRPQANSIGAGRVKSARFFLLLYVGWFEFEIHGCLGKGR